MVNNFGMPQFGNYVTNAWNNMNWNTAGNFENFGTFNNFGTSMWANPWGFPVGGTTKKKSNEELAVECAAEIAKIDEQIAQVQEAKSKVGLIQAPDGSVIEAEAGQQQLQDGTVIEVQLLEEMQKAHKEADTTADGTKVTYAKTEKMSFWQKVKRGTGNVFKAAMNTATSFFGKEPDGSWNWKKCLKNVGIAVGTIALCALAPYAAPAVTAIAGSFGVSAATAASVGIAAGKVAAFIPAAVKVGTKVARAIAVYKCAEGVYNGCTAETTKEFDESWQQVGSAGFTLFGTKILGKAINKATGVATSISQTTTQAQPQGSWLSRKWDAGLESVKGDVKSLCSIVKHPMQTFRGDMNLSLNKGIIGSTCNDYVSVRNNCTSMVNMTAKNIDSGNKGQIWKDFGKTVKVNRTRNSRIRARQERKAFEEQKQKFTNELNSKIADLDSNIRTANASTKPILETQKAQLEALKTNLSGAKTSSDWIKMQKDFNVDSNLQSKTWYNPRGWFRRFGTARVNGQEVNQDVLNAVREQNSAISSTLNSLAQSRVSSIKSMAGIDAYKTEVKDFGYNRWNPVSRYWDMANVTSNGFFGKGFRLLTYAGIVSTPIQSVSWSPSVLGNPVIQAGFTINDSLTGFTATPTEGIDTIWTEDLVGAMDDKFDQIDEGIEALNKQKQAIYKKYEDLMA